MVSKADEYRAKSLQCELQASKAADAEARATYEELARGWANLATNVELRQGAGDSPPPQGA